MVHHGPKPHSPFKSCRCPHLYYNCTLPPFFMSERDMPVLAHTVTVLLNIFTDIAYYLFGFHR